MWPSSYLRRVGVRDFPFRGLLRLTVPYGLPACSPSFPWTLSPGFRETDYLATLLVSFPAYRQLHIDVREIQCRGAACCARSGKAFTVSENNTIFCGYQ